MIALIAWIGRATGLSSLLSTLIAYALIAALAGGSLWAYGAYKHHQGYAAGSAQERLAWEEARRREIAKREEQRRQAQAKIDQLEQDYLDQKARADSAMAELEAEISKASPNPVFPKSLAESLNRIGR